MVTSKQLLVYLSIKYKGVWDDIFGHIQNKKPLDYAECEKTLENVNLGDYFTLTDKDYPEELRGLEKPPFALKKADYNNMVARKRYLEKYGRKIASWLYAEAVENSNEGDWITYFDEIDETFNLEKPIEQDRELQQRILDELSRYDGVAIDDDTLQEDCFDVNLYTDYMSRDCEEE